MKDLLIGITVGCVIMLALFFGGVYCGVQAERESQRREPLCEMGEGPGYTCVESEPPLGVGVGRPYLLCTWRSSPDYRIQAPRWEGQPSPAGSAPFTH